MTKTRVLDYNVSPPEFIELEIPLHGRMLSRHCGILCEDTCPLCRTTGLIAAYHAAADTGSPAPTTKEAPKAPVAPPVPDPTPDPDPEQPTDPDSADAPEPAAEDAPAPRTPRRNKRT